LNNRLLLYALLGAIALGVFLYLRPMPAARQIEKRLDALAQVIEKNAEAGQLSLLAGTQRITAFFAENARMNLEPLYRTPINRRELASLIFQAQSQAEEINISLYDRQVTVANGAQTATQKVTVSGRITINGQTETQVHSFLLDWIKVDREWYIQRVEPLQSIRAPQAG
jgi:hypothetical protein